MASLAWWIGGLVAKSALRKVSPGFVEALKPVAKELESVAEKTENKHDDRVLSWLNELLG